MEDCERKYKEAFNMAVLEHKSDNEAVRESIERIFPQLKESEDEKIRKALISYFKQFTNEELRGVNISDWIAWLQKQGKHANFRNKIQIGDKVTRNDNGELVNLSQLERVAKKLEKQGEQNPDEHKVVEPKFKVEDWVVNNNSRGVYKVTEIRDDEYCLWPLDGEVMGYFRIIDVDNDYHPWTIDDAKDGDVLVTPNQSIFIFKEIKGATVYDYCGLYFNEFCDEPLSVNGTIAKELPKNYVPATREQRDLLFQKMEEAGYEWDAEKKELKKIEQNPAWSEEDEINYNYALAACKYYGEAKGYTDTETHQKTNNWLKSLKDRVGCEVNCTTTKEWSEEDEERLSDAIFFVREYQIPTRDKRLLNAAKETEDWLKSLKEKFVKFDKGFNVGFSAAKYNQWKPSDWQMASITCAVRKMKESACYDSELVSLYQDLKKLKG